MNHAHIVIFASGAEVSLEYVPISIGFSSLSVKFDPGTTSDLSLTRWTHLKQ